MCVLDLIVKLMLVGVWLMSFSCDGSNAHGIEIECIPLKSCPTILKLVLTRKHTPETSKFLRHSYCGHDQKNEPKVWCSKLDFCVTPQGINGTCIPLKKCKPFLQLASTSDTSNPQVGNFLRKFRCNEILEEEHVCCQTEPMVPWKYEEYEDLTRTERDQPNFHETPVPHDRFYYEDFAYYDPSSDESSDYTNYQSRFGTFDTPSQKAPVDSSEQWDNRWEMEENFKSHDGRNFYQHTPGPRDFVDPNYSGVHQKYPEVSPRYHEVYEDMFNTNFKRGTSTDEYIPHDIVPETYWNHFGDTTNKATYDQTTERNKYADKRHHNEHDPTTGDTTNKATYDQTTERNKYADKRHHNEHDPTTETSPTHTSTDMSFRGRNSGKTHNPNHIVTTEESRITHKQKLNSNRGKVTTTTVRGSTRTTTATAPSSARPTTSKYDRTTAKERNDSPVGGGGDIIFEDDFEDIVKRRKTTSTITEKSTKSADGRNTKVKGTKKACETPERKTGFCTKPSNCQPYKTLQKNLDKSKQSVKDYLTKFKCNSEEICCQDGDENVIDNTLFNEERTNEHVPAPISKICGRQTANSDRIVGGRQADLGEFPWLALLQYPSNRGMQPGCGGTLINARYVLTAAHCVDEEVLRQKMLGQVRQVVLGEFDIRNKTDCIYMKLGVDCADPAKTFQVESVIKHSQYNFSTTQHDIALIRLDQEVTFTDYIKPICLPTKTSTLWGNETFNIAGWGRTATEKFSPVLRKAKIPYVDQDKCRRKNGTLIEGQFCAGLGNGTDSCNGDSGGPVMLDVNFNFEFVTHLVGIISYGFGQTCGSGPSVSTYVPFYIDWINRNVKP